MRFPNSDKKVEMFSVSIGVADIPPFYDALVGFICGFGKEEGGRDKKKGRRKEKACGSRRLRWWHEIRWTVQISPDQGVCISMTMNGFPILSWDECPND